MLKIIFRKNSSVQGETDTRIVYSRVFRNKTDNSYCCSVFFALAGVMCRGNYKKPKDKIISGKHVKIYGRVKLHMRT